MIIQCRFCSLRFNSKTCEGCPRCTHKSFSQKLWKDAGKIRIIKNKPVQEVEFSVTITPQEVNFKSISVRV